MTFRDFFKVIRTGYSVGREAVFVIELIEEITHFDEKESSNNQLFETSVQKWLAGSRGGYQEWVKNNGWTKEKPIDDNAFVRFLMNRTTTTWREIQKGFRSINSDDLIKCEAEDVFEFWESVLCQFKVIVGVPLDIKLKQESILPSGLPIGKNELDDSEMKKMQHEYKHNLPLRNPNYKNRQAQKYSLDGIRRGFGINIKTPNTQVIHGMGGVGKTQLASEYAHHFWNEYPVICWLSANTLLGHATDFIKYMEPKECERLQGIQDNSSALIAVFRQWLENNIGWLLVVDDVENMKQLEPFLPKKSDGHILLTSRSAIRGIGQTLHLDVLDEDTAVDFLVDAAKCQSREDARTLARRLGYFPLALEQAAAYIAAWPDIDFAKYISMLDKNGLKMFDDEDNDRDYRHTVNTVWEITVQKICEANEAAVDLLYMCSYFAPDDIDFSAFVKKAEAFTNEPIDERKQILDDDGNIRVYSGLPIQLLHELRNEISRRRLISELTKYSLAKYDHEKGTLSMHGLLQEVLRNDAIGNNFYIYCCASQLDWLSPVHNIYYVGNMPHLIPTNDYEIKLPHLRSIITNMEPFLYDNLLPVKDMWKVYKLIADAYFSLSDKETAYEYNRKAMAFAYRDGLTETDNNPLIGLVILSYYSDLILSGNTDYMAGYPHETQTCWVESNVLKLKIDYMKEPNGEKHPNPLIIEISYPFKNAPE